MILAALIALDALTRTERTELVSMWTAANEIHANSSLLEPVYTGTRVSMWTQH